MRIQITKALVEVVTQKRHPSEQDHIRRAVAAVGDTKVCFLRTNGKGEVSLCMMRRRQNEATA